MNMFPGEAFFRNINEKYMVWYENDSKDTPIHKELWANNGEPLAADLSKAGGDLPTQSLDAWSFKNISLIS